LTPAHPLRRITSKSQYCGICHSDLHTAAGHLSGLGLSAYPCVPGHELAGVVAAVGAKVTKVKPGDHVGVGCMVDSCLSCAACRRGEEQKCMKVTMTYGGKNNNGRAAYPASAPQHTLGGYCSRMVVHEHFAVVIPKSYPLEYAGPVMCAGITLFDPLRRYGATKGTRVCVIGIGGLGQMGLRLAKALGCKVTAVTRSAAKASFAKDECSADAVIVSSDAAAIKAASKSMDLILNTVPVEHDFYAYTSMLAPGGKQIMLGLSTGLIAGMVVDGIVCGGSRIKGSGIGGIESTQAVIDLCAQNGIKPAIKVIPVEGINRAYEALDASNDSGERYVIDLAGSLNEGAVERCKAAAPPKFGPPPPTMSACSIIGQINYMLCCCKF
jgi:uncharacterized zinc-type alcohol dehydrogenase-like protein